MSARMKMSVFNAGFLLALAAGAAAEPLPNELTRLCRSASSQINESLAENVDTDAPGLVVLVDIRGDVVHATARGVRDLDSHDPLTLDTPFYIASIAKAFTAAGILALHEQGRLRLDDPASKYLTAIPSYAEKVTLRQLASHTSGLPDHYDVLGGEEQARGIDNDDVLTLLRKQRGLLFEPGDQWSYSNSGYVLLALIIEKVSGKPLRQFLRERIFEPAGMTNTFVCDDDRITIPGRAEGYVTHNGSYEHVPYQQSTTGAGGMYSTANDLRKFVDALWSGKLLKIETLREATTAVRTNSDRPTPYGLGWMVESWAKGPLKGVHYAAQFGSLGGFRAWLLRIPDKRLTLITLSNCGWSPLPDEICDKYATYLASDR